MNNIIPFPGKTTRGKALGKHMTSSHINPNQVQSRFGALGLKSAVMFRRAPTTFHMEVAIKLTLETSHE